MKVLLSSPLNSVTGYGNDGISLIQALLRWGADVYVHPTSVHPPLPKNVAASLTKPIPKTVDLLISHRCPQELARPVSAGVHAVSTVALAWTMWEWDSLSNVDALDENNCEHSFRVTDHIAESLHSFDTVLAYDPVSRQAMEPFHPRVVELLGGVEPLPYVERDWNANPFTFVMAGQLSARKNPVAAIAAFRDLKLSGELGPDARFRVKTLGASLPPAMMDWCPDLEIITDMWSGQQMRDFYASAHCLIAPSWGEGKNIPVAQFAMSGGAVATTLRGGPSTYLTEDWCYPIPFEVAEWTAGSRGAKASHEGLKEVILAVYRDRAEAARRGRLAASVVPRMLSWDAALEKIMLRLPEFAPGPRGAEVSTLMRACRQHPEDMSSEVERETTALIRSKV